MFVTRVLGWSVGAALAAVFAPLSLVAGRRALHWEGVILRAEVHPHPDAGSDPLALALCGPALVRLSPTTPTGTGAHIIGLGVRFRRRALVTAHPDHGDQDLLLATFEGFRPRQLAAARTTTNVDDWLANEYRSVMRFCAGEDAGVELRAVGTPAPAPITAGAASAKERLERAVAARAAVLVLERRDGAAWRPLVELRLCERVDVPPLRLHPANLHLSPERAGRGLRPEGFLAAVRQVVYPAVKVARGLRGG